MNVKIKKEENKSLYIHIPFCKNICSYCDFCKIYYNEKIIDNYLDELKKEIKLKSKNYKFKTIYIGGGSPSSLNNRQLEILLLEIDKIKKSNECEYTIEVNPDDMDDEKIKLLKSYNINRVSIGVQTFDKNIKKILNRTHSNEHVFNLIDKLNKIGIPNINIDMMFSIPEQTIESLNKDLEIISTLNIKHISYYSLILENHTKLYIDKFKVFDEDIEYLMYKMICQKLQKIGFNHYEISNFSKSGYESIHNLNYWKNKDYIGVGLGAYSKYSNEIINNTKSISNYLQHSYEYNKEILSYEDILINELMLGLRLIKGINKKEFESKYNKSIYDVFSIQKEINNNRLIDDSENIYIPLKYIYVSNDIIVSIIIEGVKKWIK